MHRQARSPEHHMMLYRELSESGAPPFWVNLVSQCLSFSPQSRYQNAGQVVAEIDKYLADQERQKLVAEKRAARRGWMIGVVVLIGLLMIAGFVVFIALNRANVETREKSTSTACCKRFRTPAGSDRAPMRIGLEESDRKRKRTH